MNDNDLKNLVSIKILTGGRRTSASNEREVYNAIIDSKLNIEDVILSAWGSITGVLSSQTDLISYLNLTHEKLSNKGIANGYAPLNGSTKIDSTYLPSYVDDVLEFANFASLPVMGATGIIYITLDNNNQYRWSGSVYIQITNSSAIWGNISGTLAAQTDLTTYLSSNYLKLDASNDPITGILNLSNHLEFLSSSQNIKFGGTRWLQGDANNLNLSNSWTISGTENTIVGHLAGAGLAGRSRTILLGTRAATSGLAGNDAIIIGGYAAYNSPGLGGGTIAIGSEAAGSGNTGINSIYLGSLTGTNSSFVNYSVMIGYAAAATEDSIFVAGSSFVPLRKFILGNGGTGANVLLDVHITSADNIQGSVNQSSAGGDMWLASARSRGTGVSADVGFKYSPPIASGTTQQSWATALIVKGNTGNIGLWGGSFADGSKTLFIANASTAPTFASVGGANLFSEGGVLKYWTSGGTLITISNGTGGTVTSISAGTGMSFSTITTTGAIALDSTKVPYFGGGITGSSIAGNYLDGAGVWTTFNTTFDSRFNTQFATKSTTDLTEGTNLYYTNSRFNTQFATKSTTDLTEGTNLYYTDARVRATLLTGLSITGSAITSADSVLGAFGKLQNQVNGLIGGIKFQGNWNASTNTPSLASGVGTQGFQYYVSVAGSTNIDGITSWEVGDFIVFNGTVWQKFDNTDSVTSVNGSTGIVSLTTTNINEGTNLYFTNSRAIASTLTGYTSGAGTVSSADTVLQAIQKLNGNIGVSQVAGATTQIQFNNTGAFGADSAFRWDNSTKELLLGSTAVSLASSWSTYGISTNGFYQVNLQNTNAGASASSDYVVTNDIGNQTANYADFGINSSTFSDVAFTLFSANSAYLYNNGGALFLGTQTAHALTFHTGGTLTANNRGGISSTGQWNINGNNITLAGAFTTSGAFTTTFTTTANTNVTLPTSGTLYGTASGSITSAQLLNSLTDETGTVLAVFNTSPTFATSVIGSASFDVFNTISTTVNAFGAATTVTIGAVTGTATLRNNIVALTGGTLTGASSQNVFNVTSTTVNAFGAATTLNIGITSTASKTIDLFGGATTTGLTKTLNIGTAGLSGSITAISLGSAVSGATNNIRLNLVPASDTTGDVFYRNSSGFLTRLGIGTVGQVLTVAGGLPSWATGSGSTPTSVTLASSSGQATVANTTTATTILGTAIGSKTIGAATMIVGSTIRITVRGIIATAVLVPNITMTVTLGVTTVGTTNSNNVGTITGTRQFEIYFDINIASATTVTSNGIFRFFGSNSIVSSVWELQAFGGPGQSTNISNISGALAVDVLCAWGTASNQNTMTGVSYTIEQLR